MIQHSLHSLVCIMFHYAHFYFTIMSCSIIRQINDQCLDFEESRDALDFCLEITERVHSIADNGKLNCIVSKIVTIICYCRCSNIPIAICLYYTMSAMTHLPMMFLHLDLIWEYRIRLVTMEIPLYRVYITNWDILQGRFRLCNWMSLRWISHSYLKIER